MADLTQGALVAAALSMARLRAVRTALLNLHKALIDAERQRYERIHGRIESAHAALRIVMDDPSFQWIRPLADVIVQIDERLADAAPVQTREADVFTARVRALLRHEGPDPRFADEYRRALQDAPDVVVAHAHVAKLFADDPGGSPQ